MPPRGSDPPVVKTNPDPTEAVKEALTLAITNLSDRFEDRFRTGNEAVVLARSELKDQLIAINSTINEKFLANKDLVDQLARANATALSAALQTQKESAAKSELSMADQLRQLFVSFETANKATNEKIDRLTSRLDTGEGRISFEDVNKRDNRKETVDNRSFYVAIIAAVIAGTALIVGLGLHK